MASVVAGADRSRALLLQQGTYQGNFEAQKIDERHLSNSDGLFNSLRLHIFKKHSRRINFEGNLGKQGDPGQLNHPTDEEDKHMVRNDKG